jgi:hypothetical protein
MHVTWVDKYVSSFLLRAHLYLWKCMQDEVPTSLGDERTFHDDIAKERNSMYVPEPTLAKVIHAVIINTCIGQHMCIPVYAYMHTYKHACTHHQCVNNLQAHRYTQHRIVQLFRASTSNDEHENMQHISGCVCARTRRCEYAGQPRGVHGTGQLVSGEGQTNNA